MPYDICRRILSWCKADRSRSLMCTLLVIIFVGGCALAIVDYRTSKTVIDDGIVRNTYGKGSRVEELIVDIEGEEEEKVQVEVSERAYTSSEMKELFGRVTKRMDHWILGENESLDRIESDMNLISQIPGEPIDVTWELDRYDVMNVYGELEKEKTPQEGVRVNLKAVLTYREDCSQQALYECMAMVYPRTLTGREAIVETLRQELGKRDEETREEAKLILPGSIADRELHFYYDMDMRGIVLMVMAVLIFVLLYALEKQNEEKKISDKRSQMVLDYPEIVSKLTLLLGAGMTVRKAWRKIVEDYSNKNARGKERFAYEEMIYTSREMDSGVTEAESYEKFGRRCNVQEYLRLGALLSQNLRKGTKGLNDLLKLEAMQAFEERKARAKRRGEEAGTKLLLPMFLMLVEVLIIVVVPAFLSIQL